MNQRRKKNTTGANCMQVHDEASDDQLHLIICNVLMFTLKVSEEDAVAAVVLYEDSVKWKYGNG